MVKISVKGRVLLTTKDFLFIIAWIVLFLFIADAFAEQARIASYFIWVWNILGVLYFLKIVDNFQMQKPQGNNSESRLEEENRIIKTPKTRFFEA